MTELTLVEAVNQALAYEMAADENVVVLGEDVAEYGGAFKVTRLVTDWVATLPLPLRHFPSLSGPGPRVFRPGAGGSM